MPKKKKVVVPAPVTRPVNHDSVVATKNSLLPYLAPLSKSELRLVAFCVAHYDSTKDDGDDRAFTARVADLVGIFPSMDLDSAYAVVRQVFLGLGKKPLETREGRTKIYRNWFSGFDYEEGAGEFTFYIPPETQPYFLRLREGGNFTPFRLRDVYQFRSAATWKLYENLARWRVAGRWAVDLDELRGLLGVAGKYPRWDNLKNRLLDSALGEINEHSDIEADYTPQRRGRSITALVFSVRIKKREDDNLVADEEAPADKLHKLLLGCGITAKAAEGMVVDAIREDKVAILVKKVPKMPARAKEKGIAIPRYVTGSVKDEIKQRPLPFDQDTNPKTAAYSCRQHFKKSGGSCAADKGEQCRICQTLL